MATFETHRKLRDALGDEGSEAVTEYVEESTSELATRADIVALRSDLDVLRAEIRGDMYRALWIQGGVIITTITALAGLGAAIVTALS